MIDIRIGDCRQLLQAMPDGSVQCVVTSPPYWGLRSYTGDAGMLGLEPTFDEHLAGQVEVFREVRRVLRADGTLWLNYGDAYAGGGRGGGGAKQDSNPGSEVATSPLCGLKPKDLMLMPARVALALQADGWWLRSEIVWHKPNPMPESVTDRPTNAHEKLFLLTKSARYFYDADAVREGAEYGRRSQPKGTWDRVGDEAKSVPGPTSGVDPSAGRNLRNVWTIPTHSFSEAHFATFPPQLVEPCILAGTSSKGFCSECRAPWRRVTKRTRGTVGRTGWQPWCECGAKTKPCVVLDPFAGAGTVGLVADRLARDAILIEISPEYAEMARNRIKDDNPLFAEVYTI